MGFKCDLRGKFWHWVLGAKLVGVCTGLVLGLSGLFLACLGVAELSWACQARSNVDPLSEADYF